MNENLGRITIQYFRLNLICIDKKETVPQNLIQFLGFIERTIII
jgi:hypothetical protein